MFDYAQARTNMVDGQIHTAGVVNSKILEAFETLPRELFVPESRKQLAYYDEDVFIGAGRFLLEPIIHSKLLEAANLQNDDLVLDIGGATGYSSAILSGLVSTVVALEQDQGFLQHAEGSWKGLGLCNIAPFQGEHQKGVKDHAPYSAIFINGAVSEVPQCLLDQLSPGGRLLTILKKPGETMGAATIIRRNESETLCDSSFSSYNLFNAGTPYLAGFEPQETFSF